MINIKEFRKSVNLSQAQLAELLKCQQPNISRLESYHADLTEDQYEILFTVFGKEAVLKYQIDLEKNPDKGKVSSKNISFVNEVMVKQNLLLTEIVKKQQDEITVLRAELELLKLKQNVQ